MIPPSLHSRLVLLARLTSYEPLTPEGNEGQGADTLPSYPKASPASGPPNWFAASPAETSNAHSHGSATVQPLDTQHHIRNIQLAALQAKSRHLPQDTTAQN